MPANSRQIFQSASARRYRRAQWTVRVVSAALLLIFIIVAFAVYHDANPLMPTVKSIGNSFKPKVDPSNTFTLATPLNKKFKGFKDFLNKRIAYEEKNQSLTNAKLIRSAFYVPWSPLSLQDLRTNGGKLNTIYPEWFFINPKTYQLDSRIDKEALSVMKHYGLSIQPILNNFISVPGKQGKFNADLLHTVLHDQKIQN